MILDNSRKNFYEKREIFKGVNNLTIITPSKWLASLAEQSFLGEYPVKVINNGIDLNIFKPTRSSFREEYRLNKRFVILGVASTWDRRKGLKYFVEMSNKLNDDETIVIIGLSQKQMKDLPANIIGISKTNNAGELAEIYSSADVFVNPTLEEVLGMTNIEALACGTPVITFNTGGSPECIDLETGIVVEKGNTQSLLQAVERLRSDPVDASLCVERAKMFDKQDRYQEYINIYRKVLSTGI
jgi:glycosyltransferase involved in cell wall biosynthesis